MPYNAQLKGNSEIFEKIRFIQVPEAYVLKPIIPELLEGEAMFYMINTNVPDVKKFLPLVVAETLEDANEKLTNYALRMMVKHSILYCIRPRNNQIPLGYIHLNSPISTTGINEWSVDFWLGITGRGIGLMSASLVHLLNYLEENQVPVVKALVDKENIACIRVLERVGFTFQNEDAEGKRFLYSVVLND